MSDSKMLVGALELCALPELEINELHIRVDTGAKTSSLHVDNITEYEKDGKTWIQIDIHPDYHNVDYIVQRHTEVKAFRSIKSSNGTVEKRYVIDTDIVLGDKRWEIELTLTDRSNMTYLMLLGREAMAGKVIVDPEREYVLGEHTGK